MPECQNCGTVVSTAYARVFTPADVDEPRACPHCEDKIRARDGIRDVKG